MRYFDRVKETTTTSGTGNVTLAGAATGFAAFSAKYDIGERFKYAMSASGGATWEVGIGYLTSATVMVRETVEASSNAGALVSLPGSAMDVFGTFSGADATAVMSSTALLIGRGNFLQ